MGFEGGCLCGAVRYVIERRHLNAMHCWCGMCRRAHGTAFSTHVVARPEQVRWIGAASLSTFASSGRGRREFCPDCGTHLRVHGQTGDDTIAVPAGTLDGDPPITLLGHMFLADRVHWLELDDDLPRYAGWPPGYGLQ